MTEDMAAVRASDELITALSQRREPLHHDVAVDALAALAEYVDAAPRPRIQRRPIPTAHRRPRTHRRLGVAIGVALAVSSSGIAAAVTGDPLSPVNFVAKNLYDFAQRHTQSYQQLGAGSIDRQEASPPDQSSSHPLERQSDADVLSSGDDLLVGSWLVSPGVSVTVSGAADPLSSVSSLEPTDVLPEDADPSQATDGDADQDQPVPDTNDEAEPEPEPVIDPAPGDDVPPDTCIPPNPDDGTTDDGQGEPASCDDPSDPPPETDPEPDPEPSPETEPAPESDPMPEPDRIPEEEPAPGGDETTPGSP